MIGEDICTEFFHHIKGAGWGPIRDSDKQFHYDIQDINFLLKFGTQGNKYSLTISRSGAEVTRTLEVPYDKERLDNNEIFQQNIRAFRESKLTSQ